jgi:hypothetical protein
MTGKELELAGKRVELATEGVGIAHEMLEQMKRWRSIARWGLISLAVTTIFAMAAVAYILVELVPDGKIGEVAAPIMIFVLAVFAISPATLLLLERPLEGLDKWSPSGPADGGGDGEEGAEEEKGGSNSEDS